MSAVDALNNFISGLIFIITLLLVLFIKINYSNKSDLGATLYYLITFLLIVSIIMGIGDIVHSFHIASQVYGQLFGDFQQQSQVNCSSYVLYSLFVSVIIVFNYIFVEIGLVIILCFWFIFGFCFDSTARSYFYV